MKHPTFTDLDFIADQLYRLKCKAENTKGPRWWALRENIREEYRATARARVAHWATTENITFQKVHGRKEAGL